jgi:hypothetical protein
MVKKIVRRSWDAIPMPDTVIARVHKLGKDEPEQFVFTDRSGRQIGDIELPGVGGANETLQENQLDVEDVVEDIDLKIAPNNEIEEEAAPQEPHPIEPHIEVETIQEDGNIEPIQDDGNMN